MTITIIKIAKEFYKLSDLSFELKILIIFFIIIIIIFIIEYLIYLHFLYKKYVKNKVKE